MCHLCKSFCSPSIKYLKCGHILCVDCFKSIPLKKIYYLQNVRYVIDNKLFYGTINYIIKYIAIK